MLSDGPRPGNMSLEADKAGGRCAHASRRSSCASDSLGHRARKRLCKTSHAVSSEPCPPCAMRRFRARASVRARRRSSSRDAAILFFGSDLGDAALRVIATPLTPASLVSARPGPS